MKKIIAAASFGGHWIQLMRLRPLLQSHRTVYVSTNSELKNTIKDEAYFNVLDAAAESKLRLALCFLQALIIVLRVRPDVVISTGAAPGFALIFWGRILGAKTIWIDSVANAEQMSRSGMLARRWASVWLSQWEDVAARSGAQFLGRVI